MLAVDLVQSPRKQNIQGLAVYFMRRIPEDPFSAPVKQNDAVLVVDGNDGIVGEVQDLGQRIGGCQEGTAQQLFNRIGPRALWPLFGTVVSHSDVLPTRD